MAVPLETSVGPVVGRAHGGVHVWRGLPHAEPPARRFAPAGPRPSWCAPLDAGVSARPSPQLVGHSVLGDETLGGRTLDVYAPAGATGLPVLVFVHGGAFVGGGPADYDGTHLATRLPAVVVTVSYRLGALGFLTTRASDPTPALTDLVAALAWVSDTVSAFGGDPGRVTLAGQSAGAAMVASLMTTPAARGRLRAAVVLSGGGWVRSPAEHAAAGEAFTAVLDADPDTASVADLLRAATRVPADPGNPRGVPFLPVVDGDVLPVPPLDAVPAVPLWLQTCRDEMAMFRPDLAADERAELTRRWWEGGLHDLAAAHPGPTWTGRFDHAPAVPPFDALGPTHGADNACLWAHPPRFVERPLLGRSAAAMSGADRAVTEELHDALARFVHDGELPWTPGARFPGRVLGG